jgi:hypothetical protein
MKNVNKKAKQQVMNKSDSDAASIRIINLTQSVLKDEYVASSTEEILKLALSLGSLMSNCAIAVMNLATELGPEDELKIHGMTQSTLNMLKDVSVDKLEEIANYYGNGVCDDEKPADKIDVSAIYIGNLMQNNKISSYVNTSA